MLKEEYLKLFKPIVQILGDKNTGKTLVAEELVRYFSSRGLKVAYIKHTSKKIEIDEASKDSFRIWKSGAEIVAVYSPEVVFIKEKPRELDLEDLLKYFQLADLIVVEGFGEQLKSFSKTIARIICLPYRIETLPNIIRKISLTNKTPVEISGELKELIKLTEKWILKTTLASQFYSKLPKINCGKCRFSTCIDMAFALAEEKALLEECITLRQTRISLRVNGKEVPLNKFVSSLLRDVVLAFIKNLKLVEREVREIDLKIKTLSN